MPESPTREQLVADLVAAVASYRAKLRGPLDVWYEAEAAMLAALAAVEAFDQAQAVTA